MVAKKLQRSAFWFLAIAILILVTDMTIARTFSFQENDPILVYAVMFDFMLVIPFLFWLFVLRRQGKSIAKILPLPLLGAMLAWLVLPVTMRNTVWNAAWPIEMLIIAAEVAFIGFEVRVLYRFFRHFRQIARQEANTGEALRIAAHEVIGKGKLASFLLHDITVVYYLLFSWRRRSTKKMATVTTVETLATATAKATATATIATTPTAAKEGNGSSLFTYHRKTSQVLYAAIITKLLIMEGVVVHLLIQQWSHWVAWGLTIADLWLLALIWADSRASALQPIKLDRGMLRLRYGLRIQADIPTAQIAEVETAREYHPDQKEQQDAALPLLSTPNIRIQLKQPIQVETLLFMPRKVTTIFLALDEPEAFVQEVGKQLEAVSKAED
ncbi:hypothetical protein [Paenibacillus eucommiae]|uniref:Beta-carotene 15,15'-monooxygenase n=1 Tax=Paenibacillus eucommiae TaxID=1355755 RepID=A0ABS4IV71_9BACL|nr:hypothetical protein [Paenibacillus eucommiae]MBP1991479.1 hypothetical protein [Paenibacillus eucommiae]